MISWTSVFPFGLHTWNGSLAAAQRWWLERDIIISEFTILIRHGDRFCRSKLESIPCDPYVFFHSRGTVTLKLTISQIVFSDTIGHLTTVDTTTGKVTRNFKSIAGAVTSIYACQSQPWIATVCLDRFLRVFNHKTGDLVQKVYLKQRMYAVIANEEGEDEESHEEEDIWEDLEVVQESDSKPRKRAKRE